jgi:3-hydroxyacyl-CoA dehydrogenase
MSRIVTLVGSGLIGRGWAMLFANAGWQVHIFDADSDAAARAMPAIEGNLELLHKEGMIDAPSVLMDRIRFSATLPEALEGASWVQESVFEDRDLKARVFREVGELTGADVVLASSCSSIPPDEFMADVRHRERCIIAHPFSPPHLIPLVEMVASSWTSPEVMARADAEMLALGQRPVRIKKPVVGFVVNRLQAAVINEGIALVEDGVISPEDLDACMSQGLGLRWAFIGPFETMELNAPQGFKAYVRKFGHLYRQLLDHMRTDRPWGEAAVDAIEQTFRPAYPTEDDVTRRRLWRDHNLMRLAKLFRGPRFGGVEKS